MPNGRPWSAERPGSPGGTAYLRQNRRAPVNAHLPTDESGLGAVDQHELDTLVFRRLRAGLTFTAATLAIYFTFILLIAFNKPLTGRILADGLSLGILLGTIVIVSTWVLVWTYVFWANRVYDPAVRRLQKLGGHAISEVRRTATGRHHVLHPGHHRGARHHLLGGSAVPDHRAVLRRGPQHRRLPERAGARRRLHERGKLPGHLRAGRAERLRRHDLLGGLAGRLADRAGPHRRATAPPRQVHLRRRGGVPVPPDTGTDGRRVRHDHRGDLLPDRADGGRRHAHQADVRHRLQGCHHHRGRLDDHARTGRRHGGHHLGPDHQGRVDVGRRGRARRPHPVQVRLQPAAPVRRGGRQARQQGPRSWVEGGHRSVGRDLARPSADVRYRRATAHPHAVLYRAKPQGGPHLGRLDHVLGRPVLPLHRRARLRRHGPGRPRGDQGRGRGWQHDLADAGADARRRRVHGLHRGGGVRHHPRRGGRSGAGRRRRTVARPVGQRGAPRQGGGKEQLRVARIATLGSGVSAVLLGLALEGQNAAFLVGLLFSVAASANFPALVMAIFWRRFTTPGAVTSILVGTVSALTLVVIGPTFWVSVLKNPHPLFNLNNPALVSMSLAFLSGIVVSLLWPERAAYAKFADAEREMILGSGAATPVPFPTLEEPLPTLTK